MNALLEGIRVLDLTDENGFLCGRLLAELGAEVIKVERPGGDVSRNIGPFYHDESDPEKSLTWFAYNLNKKGITLDIRRRDGQGLFKQLVKQSDLVIESYRVGAMRALGLDYPRLKEVNQGIIMVSITPFGQTGPYSPFVASDLIAQAMSGYLYLCGDPDRPPVRVSLPLSPLHAGGEAAVAALIALVHKETTGEGQYVDVSAQQSMVRNTVNANAQWSTSGIVLERSGPYRVGLGFGTRARQTWRCKDGQVNFVIFGGSPGAASNKQMAQWLREEGLSTEQIDHMDWDNFDVIKFTQDDWDQLEAPIGRLFKKHTKEDLFIEGIKRRMGICPVLTPAELMEFPQLSARNAWVDVEHPELGCVIKYPASGMRFAARPALKLRRAPLIGEHNWEVFHGELGLSLEEINRLKQSQIV
jgi:benzylsuccinate CoA-transferase BbsE subunit